MSGKQNEMQVTFTIPLTQGQVALVDERDFYRLRKHKWCAQWDAKIQSFYAVRSTDHPDGGRRHDGRSRKTKEYMHRVVVNLKRGDRRQVDHENHETLDNRSHNLRIVTTRGNHENMRNQSGYGVGVSFCSDCKHRPFRSSVYVNGRTRYGFFATVEEARAARKGFVLGSGE